MSGQMLMLTAKMMKLGEGCRDGEGEKHHFIWVLRAKASCCLHGYSGKWLLLLKPRRSSRSIEGQKKSDLEQDSSSNLKNPLIK